METMPMNRDEALPPGFGGYDDFMPKTERDWWSLLEGEVPGTETAAVDTERQPAVEDRVITFGSGTVALNGLMEWSGRNALEMSLQTRPNYPIQNLGRSALEA